MEHLRTIGLLDSDGQPFHPRIERVLIQLLPRLRREFPSLQDEVGLAEIMEEAGRRIRHREVTWANRTAAWLCLGHGSKHRDVAHASRLIQAASENA